MMHHAMHALGVLSLTGIACTAGHVFRAEVAPQWRRILRLAIGQPAPGDLITDPERGTVARLIPHTRQEHRNGNA